jgi:hypothetical protein
MKTVRVKGSTTALRGTRGVRSFLGHLALHLHSHWDALVDALQEVESVDIGRLHNKQPLKDPEQTLEMPFLNDHGGTSHKHSLPQSNKGWYVSPLFPHRRMEERNHHALV